ncbi:cytochrome P450 [Mycena sp. CBHHK59/15]|nr:cytochrome P450 [Mycena sp. CBHHK59/15]
MAFPAASTVVAVSLVTLFVYRFFSALASVDHVPGMRPLFSPMSLWGVACGTSWWNPGLIGLGNGVKLVRTFLNNIHVAGHLIIVVICPAYFRQTHDVISVVPLIAGDISYHTASLNVMKQVLANEGRLIKPPRIFISLWGDNVVAANGDMWKRHRRIVAPAFTNKTHSLVVAETLTLTIIARCGFGLPMPWADAPAEENELTFAQSLTIVTQSVIPRLVIPAWLYKLPVKRLRTFELAWSSLGEFMHRFVRTEQEKLHGETAEASQRGDVFSRLVAAMDADSKQGLDEQEVIGNTFTPSETTAAILSATLGFLAIYEEEQEKAHSEIVRAIPAPQDPSLDDMSKLPHLLACFHETMRLFPAAAALYREMTEDTPVKVTRPTEKTLVFKRGSLVVIDLISLHRNPNIFLEPDVFRPPRWYGVSEHDVSMFGYGPRACLAKKFTNVEALCFLALFLRDWKVSIPLPAGESMAEYEERVMRNAGRVGLAFGVRSISLKLTRRR